jgi:hypothetical protein
MYILFILIEMSIGYITVAFSGSETCLIVCRAYTYQISAIYFCRSFKKIIFDRTISKLIINLT